MRKMSEIINISKSYHASWGGVCEYMCNAVRFADREGAVTYNEWVSFRIFIEEFIHSLCEISKSLHSSLEYVADLSGYDYEDIMYLVYEAIIDKLESEGN